jgi:hypothetical protein
MGGSGVDDPVGQRLDADAAGFQGGDDLDQVAQVAAEPVDLPDDEGVAGPQVGQAFVPFGPAGFGAGRGVGLGLQAVLGGQRVELELRVLVGGGDPGISSA